MKYKKLYIVTAAIAIGFAVLSTSCESNEVLNNGLKFSDKVLEVNLLGVQESRSILQGSTFPNDSIFGVYTFLGNTMEPVKDGKPARVTYIDNKCLFDSPILLPESADVSVYAFYPYAEYLFVNEIFIDSKTQIDYLAGYGVDNDGKFTYANPYTPSVNIRFEHCLARVTLNIHKDKGMDSYKIPSVSLGGDGEKSYRSAYYDAALRRFFEFRYDSYPLLKGEFKDNKYWLETEEDVVIVDFLVIPSETIWSIFIDEIYPNWWNLPMCAYESGKQYIYDCVIGAGNKITISECEIKPWENNDMPEVEIK